jgi:predicted nucleotidyltransferase
MGHMGHGAQTSDISSRQMAFLSEFADWAQGQAGVNAVALVGSHARGVARSDSDVDLVILADHPDAYLTNPEWVDKVRNALHRPPGGLRRYAVDSRVLRRWAGGRVRIHINSVAATTPIDEGTEEVVRDGVIVLVDKGGRLEALIRAIGKVM